MTLHLLLPPAVGLPRATARAELLEVSLASRLGRPVRVEVARSYRDLERGVLGRGADLAWAPPVLCGRAEASARLVLQAIRGGRTTYRAALIARKSDRLAGADLAGKRAAWVDSQSAGGYLLPRALLRSRGHDPDRLLGTQRFLGSYRDALLAVVSGQADLAPILAGDGSEADVRTALADQIGPEARLLEPVAVTGEAPNDGLLFTDRLGPDEIREILLRLLPLDEPAPDFLLDICEADSFTLARRGLYRAFLDLVAPDADG